MKVDVCMWTKNSAKFLPLVLKRLNEALPKEVIQNKIISDDHSKDTTIEIGEKFGWTVYENRGRGIADNITTALRHVTSDFFISIEHDVILSNNWWERISRYMEDESIAVAQGVRVATHPLLRKLDEYVLERKLEPRGGGWISIDNNIYRTVVIRRLGINLLSHDILRRKIREIGMKWVIDRKVVSDHIRTGIRQFINHTYTMHKRVKTSRFFMFKIFAFSPFRGLHITLRKHSPEMIILYPIIRLAILRGSLEGER